MAMFAVAAVIRSEGSRQQQCSASRTNSECVICPVGRTIALRIHRLCVCANCKVFRA